MSRHLDALTGTFRLLTSGVKCVILALLAGCASPAERMDAMAGAYGFTRSVEAGVGYAHVVYSAAKRESDELHVYIDNDGRPWAGRYSIAADPTPDHAVMLEMMSLDSSPSVYLGRPCYIGLAGSAPCSPYDWTHGRYSTRVVDSMAAAIRGLLSRKPVARLSFFGHSGGGALAVLLAARFAETVAVVTLGGNLDIHVWARFHGFTELRGSLNPIEQSPLPMGVLQRHYVGIEDGNVTPSMLFAYGKRHPGAVIRQLPNIDHDCCWRAAWIGILRQLERDLAR